LACTSKFLSDARRQIGIGGFYLPGDYFGFECSDAHALSAEAVTNVKARIIKKSLLAAVAGRDAIERQLLSLTTRELARLQTRALLLIKNAQERVGEFILEMEKRTKAGNSIRLPMKRQDDYLGLTIEPVSRILTPLEGCTAIEMPTSHQIVLRNRSVLRAATEDQSKGALSNPQSISSTTRKRLNRCYPVRTRARRRILPRLGNTIDDSASQQRRVAFRRRQGLLCY